MSVPGARDVAKARRGAETCNRLSERERWAALQGMTMEETVAAGEALLTSEWMDLAAFPHDDALKILELVSKPHVDPMMGTLKRF